MVSVFIIYLLNMWLSIRTLMNALKSSGISITGPLTCPSSRIYNSTGHNHKDMRMTNMTEITDMKWSACVNGPDQTGPTFTGRGHSIQSTFCK